jgi:hypothetical protein
MTYDVRSCGLKRLWRYRAVPFERGAAQFWMTDISRWRPFPRVSECPFTNFCAFGCICWRADYEPAAFIFELLEVLLGLVSAARERPISG